MHLGPKSSVPLLIEVYRLFWTKLLVLLTEKFYLFSSAAWNKNGILGENNKDPKKSVTSASTAMNHLLLGKKPLVAKKPRRPPPPGK